MNSDIESQATALSGPESLRAHPAAATGAGSPAAVLLRKVMLLTTREVTDSSHRNYLLTIVKDVISGTILGVFFLMVLIFLDYHNVVQLGSARAFRRAAFELMTDPETVKSIEDNIDVKFVPLEVYKSMRDAISRNQDKIMDTSGYNQHQADWNKKNEELEGMKKEHSELKATADRVLGLDKWCGHCKAGWGNCNSRIKYLMDTYHSPEMRSKLEIMKEGKCVLG